MIKQYSLSKSAVDEIKQYLNDGRLDLAEDSLMSSIYYEIIEVINADKEIDITTNQSIAKYFIDESVLLKIVKYSIDDEYKFILDTDKIKDTN